MNRVDPDGRDSIPLELVSNALFNFGFAQAAGVATIEDFNAWLWQSLTSVFNWFDEDSETLTVSVCSGCRSSNIRCRRAIYGRGSIEWRIVSR